MTAGRTAIVVSPLIALMQDQTAQLEQMGVPCRGIDRLAVCGRAIHDFAQRKNRKVPATLSFSRTTRAQTGSTWLRDIPIFIL